MYPVVSRALSAAAPSVIQTASTGIGNLVGRAVAPSASGIVGAIKSWAANNPGKMLVAVNLLASLGIDIAISEVEDFLGDKIHNPQIKQLMSEVTKNLTNERNNIVGDGNPDTVHGIDENDYLAEAEKYDDIMSDIRVAARAAGGIKPLLAIRKAIFLEDVDFELYSRRVRRGMA